MASSISSFEDEGAFMMAVPLHGDEPESARFTVAEDDNETSYSSGRMSRSEQFREAWKRRDAFVPSIWIFLTLLAIAAALLGVAVDASFLGLHMLRKALLEYKGIGPVCWVVLPVICSLLATALCRVVSRAAEGSGIPEMRSVLMGVHLRYFLSLRTLIVKCVGLSLALGSGLSVGKEGPFVHATACIAELLMRYVPSFEWIRADSGLRRRMLAAAVAAGVTAAFGTTVGGVLFSIEITVSYFQVSNLWRCFYCAVVTVCVFIIMRELSIAELFRETDFERFELDWQLVSYSLLGITCGGLGVFFVWSVARVRHFITHGPASPHGLLGGLLRQVHRVLSCRWKGTVVVAVLAGLLTLPPMLRHQGHQTINDMFSLKDLRDFPRWNTPNVPLNLAIFCFVRLALTVVSVLLPLPTGVFSPVFATGAVFGRLWAELSVAMGIMSASSHVQLGSYAVVGAAALTAGVTRTLSTALIVFELTGQLHHVLPVLLSVLLAYAVASAFSVSVYDVLKTGKGLPHDTTFHEVATTKTAEYLCRCGATAGELQLCALPTGAGHGGFHRVARQYFAQQTHRGGDASRVSCSLADWCHAACRRSASSRAPAGDMATQVGLHSYRYGLALLAPPHGRAADRVAAGVAQCAAQQQR
ncbi:MAG: hypothetical protein MHM6MM_002005 [Cercozoa sp. M6MM]